MIKFATKACQVVYVISINTTVECFYCQSTPRKLITNAKMSWIALDIQRSKLVIANYILLTLVIDTITWFFPPCQINFLMNFFFFERFNIWGHKHIMRWFSHTLSTNCKGKWFFTIKTPRFSTKVFFFHLIFKKKVFWNKIN